LGALSALLDDRIEISGSAPESSQRVSGRAKTAPGISLGLIEGLYYFTQVADRHSGRVLELL
jgi:hypothetical protein